MTRQKRDGNARRLRPRNRLTASLAGAGARFSSATSPSILGAALEIPAPRPARFKPETRLASSGSSRPTRRTWQTLFRAIHEFPQGLPFLQTGPVRLVLRVADRDLRAATTAEARSVGAAVALSVTEMEQSRETSVATMRRTSLLCVRGPPRGRYSSGHAHP